MQRNKHFIQTLYVETNTLAKFYDISLRQTVHCMWKLIIVRLIILQYYLQLHESAFKPCMWKIVRLNII